MSEADSYDAIPYESTPFADTHPGHLACLARLYGVPAVDPTRCRVLEIGCANGGNLIPMAARLPGSRFLGIELSARQAEDGAARVAALGLANCEIRAGDILDSDAGGGDDGTRFDYIVAHGVWSWAPPVVRERIFSLAAERLSEHGILYVSYNSLPGWRMRGMLRDMLLYRVRGIDVPAERLAVARQYLDFLHSALGDIEATNAIYLRYEIERIRTAHPSYLFHEYLETFNEPVLFRDFVNAAAEHGLDYVCDIDLRMQFPSYLGEHVDAMLGAIDDPFEQWQQIDFLVNRNFHQSLLCRAGCRPSREPDLERLREFAWLGDVKPPRKLDLRRVKSQTYTEAGGEQHDIEHPLTKAAVAILSERYPQPVPYAELHAQAVHLVRGHGAAQFAAEEGALLGELFGLYAIGFLTARPLDQVETSVNAPWQIDAIARIWAGLGDSHIPSQHHTSLGLDAFSRRLVTYLDGGRDRDALVEALVAEFESGHPLADLVAAGTPAEQVRRQVERNLDRLIVLFRRQGVLG